MLAVLAVLTGSTLCPVAALTGTACPGCGMTRAVVALARGDLSAAWRWHPLAPLVAGYAAGTAIHWRRHRRAYVRGHFAVPHAAVLATLAVALVSVWVARLAGGTLPPV